MIGQCQVRNLVSVRTSSSWSLVKTLNDFVPFSEQSIKPYNKHLINLVCSVRTAGYRSSFFSFLVFIKEKNSVHNLPYGPRTRLIRGMYFVVSHYVVGITLYRIVLLYGTVWYCIVFVLHCIALFGVVLYCNVLHCIVWCCIVLYCIILYCLVLFGIISYHIVPYRIVFSNVLHCVGEKHYVLHIIKQNIVP